MEGAEEGGMEGGSSVKKELSTLMKSLVLMYV